ncbi:MAG: DUF2332 domain-containing protein [Sphingorhabdus sp.]
MGDLLDIGDIATGILHQAEHCEQNGALATGRIVRAQLALMQGGTRCGQRLATWPGKPLEDALPLRLAGGFHHLLLTGADDRLAPVYAGKIVEQAEVDMLVSATTADHDEKLLLWFESPPQTNEAGRSASFMAGLKWLSGKLGARFEMNELGASAGINTMMERYHYDLGGVMAGPAGSPMQIKPEWRGPPPPDNPVEITAITGCDQAPVDLSDAASALRVKSYVWPENAERIARMDAAIKLACERRPDVAKTDAADWVEQRLAAPQEVGVTRVFHHSIVWQYIPEDRRQRIYAALTAAGENATAEKPLAWMGLETNRKTFRHELKIRYWPGPEKTALLGQAQAHGAWVEWFA